MIIIVLVQACKCCSPQNVRIKYTNPGSYLISNCQFLNFDTSIIHGGVIGVNAANINLSIFSATFYNCRCSYNGGAIDYSSSTGGNFIFDKGCANKCYTKSTTFISYQFAGLGVSDNGINEISLVSCSQCSPNLDYTKYDCMNIGYGNQKIISCNLTSNYAAKRSGITGYLIASFVSKYCTFSNSESADTTLLQLIAAQCSPTINFMNFINCSQKGNTYGLIHLKTPGQLEVSDSTFSKNTKVLFFIEQGTILLKKNIISHNMASLSYGSVTTESNNQFISDPNIGTIALSFYSTDYCLTDVFKIPSIASSNNAIPNHPHWVFLFLQIIE